MRAALLILVLLGLPACESWKTSARINPHSVAVYPGGIRPGAPGARAAGNTACPLTNGLFDTNAGSINLDCFRFPDQQIAATIDGRPADTGQPTTAYKLAALGDEAGRINRNRLMSVLVTHADNVCVIEKGRLVATQSSANFGLSFLTSAFAGASTIVGGETANAILSGAANLANATRSNVNENFYRNQITQAINSAIDRERQRLMTEINASRSLAPEVFDVDQMVALVNAYHHACSFERGLQLLLDASLDASGANAALEERSRERAIAELELHIARLRSSLSGLTGDAQQNVQRQLDEARARLHGLRMAGSQRMIVAPNTGSGEGGGPDAGDDGGAEEDDQGGD